MTMSAYLDLKNIAKITHCSDQIVQKIIQLWKETAEMTRLYALAVVCCCIIIDSDIPLNETINIFVEGEELLM